MKFEERNGKEYIILDKNDHIYFTTKDAMDENCEAIEVAMGDNGFCISGNSSLIEKISGEGMLSKVYLPPVLPAEEIVEKCDQWLEMYKKVHDKFKELVLTERYKKQHVTMALSFFNGKSLDGSKDTSNISLNLQLLNDVIQEGVSISINEDNDDIFQYLMVNVLDYYLAKNYSSSNVGCQSLDWNGILFSDYNGGG